MSTPQQDPPDIPTSQAPPPPTVYATAPASDSPPDAWAPTTEPPPYGSTTTVTVPGTWAFDGIDFDGTDAPAYDLPSAPPPPAFTQNAQQYSPLDAAPQAAPQEGLDYLNRHDHANWVTSGQAPANQRTYVGYLVHGSGLSSTQIRQIGGLSTEERTQLAQALNPTPAGPDRGRPPRGRDRRMHQGHGAAGQGGPRR